MADHVPLAIRLQEWAAAGIAAALPDTACEYTASICAHPSVPPPHLCVLIYITVPSLAQLGTRIGHASVLPLDRVGEDAVRSAAGALAIKVAEAQRLELAVANGGADARILNWPPHA